MAEKNAGTSRAHLAWPGAATVATPTPHRHRMAVVELIACRVVAMVQWDADAGPREGNAGVVVVWGSLFASSAGILALEQLSPSRKRAAVRRPCRWGIHHDRLVATTPEMSAIATISESTTARLPTAAIPSLAALPPETRPSDDVKTMKCLSTALRDSSRNAR